MGQANGRDCCGNSEAQNAHFQDAPPKCVIAYDESGSATHNYIASQLSTHSQESHNNNVPLHQQHCKRSLSGNEMDFEKNSILHFQPNQNDSSFLLHNIPQQEGAQNYSILGRLPQQNLQIQNNQSIDEKQYQRYQQQLEIPQVHLRANQLTQLIGQTPVLELRVIVGSPGGLQAGKVFFIDCQGAEESLRQERDGYTYFGTKKREIRLDENVRRTKIMNDLLIKQGDEKFNKRHRGRHFCIRYDLRDCCYNIRDLGVGFGVFQRLDIPTLLQENMLVSVGETFLVANFLYRDESAVAESIDSSLISELQLRLRVYGAQNSRQQETQYCFSCRTQKSFTLGRAQNCDIVLHDALLSKVQCQCVFREGVGWLLIDGDGAKSSTNGTWLYLAEELTLVTGTVFKAHQIQFQVSVHQPQQEVQQRETTKAFQMPFSYKNNNFQY